MSKKRKAGDISERCGVENLDLATERQIIASINSIRYFKPTRNEQFNEKNLRTLFQVIADHAPHVFATAGRFRTEYPEDQKDQVAAILGRILRGCTRGEAYDIVYSSPDGLTACERLRRAYGPFDCEPLRDELRAMPVYPSPVAMVARFREIRLLLQKAGAEDDMWPYLRSIMHRSGSINISAIPRAIYAPRIPRPSIDEMLDTLLHTARVEKADEKAMASYNQ